MIKRRSGLLQFCNIFFPHKLLQDWINEEERLPPKEQTEMMLDLAQRICV